MTKTKPNMWRRGIALSATFLILIVLSTSCKKKDSLIGKNTIDQNDLLSSGGVDTFSLVTFSIAEDSIRSSNKIYTTLGSYNDPVFGTVNGEFYSQFSLSEISPDFGITSDIVIDSFVLGLEYEGRYGEVGNQTVEVYQINDAELLSIDSTYYSFDTFSTSATNLVPVGTELLDFNETNITVIGLDTVAPQLRIQLDTNLARSLFDEWDINPTIFDDNNSFQEYFKGLHVKTNNGLQSPGEGGLFYFSLSAPLSKATIYFTQNGTNYTYDLLITSVNADFNHVDIDNSMTLVETVIQDTISGQTEFYTQSYGSKAVVQIPHLDQIPNNVVVHSATLHLPVQYQSGSPYHPGTQLSVSLRDFNSDDEPTQSPYSGLYDDYNKEFTIDVRQFIQGIVNNDYPNSEIIIQPLFYELSGDRIIFNGPETTNKAKPRLTIVYTEY